MHLGRARVEPPAVIARTKVLDDPARIFHLDGLATRIAQVQDARERIRGTLLLRLVLCVLLRKGVGALLVHRLHGGRVEDAVLHHHAGERAEQGAARIRIEAKVESPRAAVLLRLGVHRGVVRTWHRVDTDQLTAPVLRKAPHLVLREQQLRKLAVLPEGTALLVWLVRQHRVRLGHVEQALLHLPLLQVCRAPQTRGAPALALQLHGARVQWCADRRRRRRRARGRGAHPPTHRRSKHGRQASSGGGRGVLLLHIT